MTDAEIHFKEISAAVQISESVQILTARNPEMKTAIVSVLTDVVLGFTDVVSVFPGVIFVFTDVV